VLEFIGSLGLFGWVVVALAVFGLVTLPKALMEYWGLRKPRDAFYRDLYRGRWRDDGD
jgi:hypothetical protein